MAAVASRLLAAVTAFVATYWLGARLGRRSLPGSARRAFAEHPLDFLLTAWRRWDGSWFIVISQHGYTRVRAAFFPLYPVLMSLVFPVVGKRALAGVLISLACYAAAMVVLYRLVQADLGSQTALWSVAFLSFVPTAFFFQAVYSESLFLLLTVTSFAAGRRGRWLMAGSAALLAALTRSAGLLLALPLAWMWFEQRRGRAVVLPGSKGDFPLLGDHRPRVLTLSFLALGPLGLVIYMAYTWSRFHDALLFVTAERHWHRVLSWQIAAVVNGAQAAARSVTAIEARPDAFLDASRLSFRDQWLTAGNLTAFIALLVALALLAMCWRRLPSAYTLYAATALLLPLSYPTPHTPLLSLPRFVLVDFPLFVALAATLAPRRAARWALLVVMALAMVVLTAMFANDMWVA